MWHASRQTSFANPQTKLIKTVPAKVSLTGTLNGTTSVSGLSSTSALAYGQVVQGVGIPADTLIQTVDSSTAITLNQAATASGSKSLTFFLEPVTLAAMKIHLKVDIPYDDSLISGNIAAARAYCEMALKQAILTSTWLLELDCFPGDGVIRLPRPPLQSVTSIQYIDSLGTLTTIDPSVYLVSAGTPGWIEPAYLNFWPTPRPTTGCVQVTFVAGYGDDASTLPPEVYGAIGSAIKLLVGHWYKNRQVVDENGIQFATVPMTVDACLASLDHGFYG